MTQVIIIVRIFLIKGDRLRNHLVNAGAVVLAPIVEAVVDVLLAPHPREARGALAPLVGLSIVFSHNS